MTNVLVDYAGHADLYYSMHALFERRLGWNVYRPDGGPRWAEEGIWTATLPRVGIDIDRPETIDDIVHIPVPLHGYSQKMITFEQFLEMDIAVIVSTTWENEPDICRLGAKYKPESVVVRSIANIGEGPVACGNVIIATLTAMPPGVNWIRMCPEHLPAYQPAPPVKEKIIKSFSGNLPSYPEDIQSWRVFKAALQDYTFMMHGSNGDDGGVPQGEMPDAMRSSMFIWHTKGNGGCGFVARQALASGKPCIVKRKYCQIHNTLSLNYFKDGVNCIDIDPKVRPIPESLRLIREWSEPKAYAKRCQTVIETFKRDVNFEAEAQAIKAWLERMMK